MASKSITVYFCDKCDKELGQRFLHGVMEVIHITEQESHHNGDTYTSRDRLALLCEPCGKDLVKTLIKEEPGTQPGLYIQGSSKEEEMSQIPALEVMAYLTVGNGTAKVLTPGALRHIADSLYKIADEGGPFLDRYEWRFSLVAVTTVDRLEAGMTMQEIQAEYAKIREESKE